MFCDYQIHAGLINDEYILCPFCDKKIGEVEKVVESGCNETDVEKNGMNICINCGSVHGYDYVPEYFDFYDSMHKIR